MKRKAGFSGAAMRHGDLLATAILAVLSTGLGNPASDERREADKPQPRDGGAPPANDSEKADRNEDDWPCFGHDVGRTGRSSARFDKLPDSPIWSFSPGRPTWDYRKGTSVWSSPVIGKVDGQIRVFVGSYDHHLYCLDGLTGTKQWVFTAGDGVLATPALVRLPAGLAVVFGSADRTIYALSAADGKKLWALETYPWKDSVSPCRMSAPAVYPANGRLIVFIGAFNNDRSVFRNVQKGDLLAINAETGQPLWRKTLSTTAVTAPCAGRVGQEERLFVACEDGVVHALNPENGESLWKYRANEQIWSSVSFAVVQERPTVFFGTRHHSVYALDAGAGKRLWKHKCGYWVDSTPAVGEVAGDPMLFFGSYDRGVYALDARTGQERWKVGTLSWVSSSAALVKVGGSLAVAIMGMDGRIYALDAAPGKELWNFHGGEFPWSHIQQGDAIWPSPAAASFGPVSLLVFPSYSYQVHGFPCRRLE